MLQPKQPSKFTFINKKAFQSKANGRLAIDVWATYRVPTRTGKPGKMGRHFPVREKSGNFEQTGKGRENDTKYWKIQGLSEKYYLLFSDI